MLAVGLHVRSSLLSHWLSVASSSLSVTQRVVSSAAATDVTRRRRKVPELYLLFNQISSHAVENGLHQVALGRLGLAPMFSHSCLEHRCASIRRDYFYRDMLYKCTILTQRN